MTQVAGGRLAASDFTLGPNQAAAVPVALTSLGEQVASLPKGFPADVLVDLQDYGNVLENTGAAGESSNVINVTTQDTGSTPPGGAVASCGGTLFVGFRTSCRFAEAVQTAYDVQGVEGDTDVTATSPVTGQTYSMYCVGNSPHICTGVGNDATVIWY